MAVLIFLCVLRIKSQPIIFDRFDLTMLPVFFWPHSSPTQLPQIHHVLRCKPIDLYFFRDLILDHFQAAQFPFSPHLSSVSHKSMWCNCINSLSHSSARRQNILREKVFQCGQLTSAPWFPELQCRWLVKVLFWPLNICVCRVSFTGNVLCFMHCFFFCCCCFLQEAGLWKLTFSQLVLTIYIWLIH